MEDRIPGRNHPWREKYLECLRDGMKNMQSCKEARVDRKTVYEYKKAHPEFLDECLSCEQEGNEFTLALVEEIMLEKILQDRHWPAIEFFLINSGKWKNTRQVSQMNTDEMKGQDKVVKDILTRLKEREKEIKDLKDNKMKGRVDEQQD